jgi:hypothetical protein
MHILKLIFQILAIVSGCIAALSSILLLVRLSWPAPMLWILKLFVGALSPVFFLTAVFCIAVGITTRSVSSCYART